MTSIEVVSEMAVVAISDPAVGLPSSADQGALLRALEPMARSGRVFYLVTDDPVRYRIGLLVGEEGPAGLGQDFEPAGGTFGLELPSGKVLLYGWSRDGAPVLAGSVDSMPGRKVLSVLARRPFEGSRHVKDMRAMLGADWTYMERVNRLGLVGCLPLLLTAIIVLAQQWRWLWYVLPLLALSWVPYLLLRRGSRYRRAERKAGEAEQTRPHFVVRVASTTQPGLAGGFLRV